MTTLEMSLLAAPAGADVAGTQEAAWRIIDQFGLLRLFFLVAEMRAKDASWLPNTYSDAFHLMERAYSALITAMVIPAQAQASFTYAKALLEGEEMAPFRGGPILDQGGNTTSALAGDRTVSE